nr:MAG TPA: hypothetical protein [Caudoviricetes sp.]
MNKAYSRINWENYPSDATPINKVNLNRLDSATDILDDRVITLDTTKATKTEVATLVSDVTFEESTGIITITKKNGSKVTIDTQMGKIAVNFDYDPVTEQIILTLIDGTKQYIDLSALITQYEFLDTDTVAFTIGTDGKVSAIVKEGSIEEKHLEPNYLAKIKVEAAKAETSRADAAASATKAESYAVGGTGSREGEDTDNAAYYYRQAKSISESFAGALRPMGTVAFASLPALTAVTAGDMYNISDEFTTTEDFKEGAGGIIPAGANIYKTSDGKWDVLAGTPVTGVKGAKETAYRRGNVNLTPANIGAVATGGDTASNVASFTSSDVADGSASSWTSVATLTSGEKHTSLFAKVSQMFKNVRYLYKMLGATDISTIGGGTVTGAISSQNDAFAKHKSSSDHDGRYYTETEINNLLAKKITASQYGAYFIGLQGDYWNIVTENGVKFVTLVNGCCILTSNTTCDIHLDIMLRDNFGIYAGCNPHTHMFNMDSFRSALNMSKLTFDSNQTSVELILSANTINAYDTKELLLAQNHYAGNENFSGLRFTQDGRVARKYYSSDGKIVWGNIYVCQSAAEAQAGTHSVMMHQGNIFRVDIYGAKYA